MKDFILVFKVLFKNQNSRRISGNGKKKLPSGIVNTLAMLPLAVLMCVLLGFLAVIIPDIYMLANISVAVVSAVQVLALFVTMFSTMNVLYNSPDTPFLNTLPIKHTAVFFAKFAILYIDTLLLTSSIIVPTLLTVSIVYAALGRAMFYGFFALIFLIALTAPILPLFIITLFSMPISYIGTYFKGRSALKSVLALIFYVLIMVGYFLLVYFLSMGEAENTDSVQMGASAMTGLGIFGKVMYPNYVLVAFCLGIDAGKNFGISFAITVGMLIVMLLLAMLFYRKINLRRLESHAETAHGAVSYKQNNIIASLIKKDYKAIIRDTNIAMSCLANILVCPVISAIMFLANDMGATAEGTPEYLDNLMRIGYIFMFTVLFLGGTNMMSMLAYSREGRSFYLTKSLPITAKDSIKAKFIASLIPFAVVMVIQVVLALALYKVDILSAVLFLLSASLTIVGSNALHIYCDMRYGNVNWNTRQDLRQVTNGNKGSFIVVFINLFIGLLALMGGILLTIFGAQIGEESAVLAIFWSVLFVLGAGVFTAGILTLHFKAEQYYEQIGERQFKARTSKWGARSGGSNMLMK